VLLGHSILTLVVAANSVHRQSCVSSSPRSYQQPTAGPPAHPLAHRLRRRDRRVQCPRFLVPILYKNFVLKENRPLLRPLNWGPEGGLSPQCRSLWPEGVYSPIVAP